MVCRAEPVGRSPRASGRRGSVRDPRRADLGDPARRRRRAVLAILTAAAEGGPRSPILPASAWIVSVLLGILWARLDSAGHAFLSGYAAIVAFGTGIGILRRHLWAWPVALASVVGFGPIVLVLVAQLPTAAVVAGFALFLVDAVALLAIHRSYLEPR